MSDLPALIVSASLVQPSMSSCDVQIASSSEQALIIVTPEMIGPFPKATAIKKSAKKRKPGKRKTLTDTLEKKELEDRNKKKEC